MEELSSILLLRHATILIEIEGKKILIDPMFASKDAWPPIPNSTNEQTNPIVDLPLEDKKLKKLLTEIDAVFVTHTHPDHWDEKAQQMISKTTQLFCQAPDKQKIKDQGFIHVIPITQMVTWNGLNIYRTGGVHGKGVLADKMGPVSGFLFTTYGKKIYVAGDTIWHEEVVQILETYQPDVIVLNAGGAQFNEGEPITMTPEDIFLVHAHAPQSLIVAIHMDSINHCLISRADLRLAIKGKPIEQMIKIPEDGERIEF